MFEELCLHDVYNDVIFTVQQIESLSSETKQRSNFASTIPSLVTKRFGKCQVNVFHYAASLGKKEIMKTFELEKKLFPESEKRLLISHPDIYGNLPYIYALINYENGPDFDLALELLKKSPNCNKQLYVGCDLISILDEKLRLSGQGMQQTLDIWTNGLTMFRRAFDFPNFRGPIAIQCPSEINWETVETLHHLPIPFLSVMLLGLRYKTSLNRQNLKETFEGQAALVDSCLDFLDSFMRLSSFSISLVNESRETIFDFLYRLYYMQVGDPLQIMRHFRFFLSWGTPSPMEFPSLLQLIIDNPLLNPLEKLNYAILLGASSSGHPIQESNEENRSLSVKVAITRIDSEAHELKAKTDQILGETDANTGLRENDNDATRERTESQSSSAVNVESSSQTEARNQAEDESLDDVDEDMDYYPAYTLLGIGNTLCEHPPSLKFLTRRCIRFCLGPKLEDVVRFSQLPQVPQFILDYIRMKEFQNYKINFEDEKQTSPEDIFELKISYERILNLQVPVIHPC